VRSASLFVPDTGVVSPLSVVDPIFWTTD
jgi:hypothetical protein